MNTQIKDFHLTIRLKNNQLLERRTQRGLNLAQMAEAVGIHYTTYCGFESMRIKPYNIITGDLKPAAEKIADYLFEDPKVLWSAEIKAVQRNILVRKFSGDQARDLVGEYTSRLALPPDRVLEKLEAQQHILDLIKNKLSPRQAKVITLRFGLDGSDPQSLDEVAQAFDPPLTKSRIGQIESYVLRKLRYSGYALDLAEHAGFDMSRQMKALAASNKAHENYLNGYVQVNND